MPNGVWHARGPYRVKTAIAASAFSKGDILMYDSTSSLSRIDESWSGVTIAGIALADSLDSFTDDKVPYLIPDAETVFWSRATPGSNYTPGAELDFDVDAAGRPVIATSGNTPRFVVEDLQADLPDLSVQSRVLGRFIQVAGGYLRHA